MTRPAAPSPAAASAKPVLFVTGHAPRDRVGAFAALHERENVEFALFGGRLQHGFATTGAERGHPPGGTRGHRPANPDGELPFPHRRVEQHEIWGLACSGRYRAVVCSTGGRVALPAAWAGARRARLPLIVWTSLWAHPRSAAHLASYAALRRLYGSAEALVTYGPHVSAYVRARGACNVYEAPQSVDNAFWAASAVAPPPAPPWPEDDGRVKFLFAGRPTRAKGLGVLLEAWSDSGLRATPAALVLVGAGPVPPWAPAGGAVRAAPAPAGGPVRRAAPAPAGGPVRRAAPAPAGGPVRRAAPAPAGGAVRAAPATADRPVRAAPAPTGGLAEPVCLAPVDAATLRAMYAACDVLVVPSIQTRTFREPWGLVVNEAMNRGLPVIASDAVGAAAGGLVRDERNGLVVPAGDARALAHAMRRLANDAELRARLGARGARDVQAYSHDAWAGGFCAALASVGFSRGGRW